MKVSMWIAVVVIVVAGGLSAASEVSAAWQVQSGREQSLHGRGSQAAPAGFTVDAGTPDTGPSGQEEIILAKVTPRALKGDPIEGEWTTKDSSVATIRRCANRLCIVMKTGDWPGMEIGQLKPAGSGKYLGLITDPRDGRTYSGRGALDGNTLKLTGCALKIFCQTEVWRRR